MADERRWVVVRHAVPGFHRWEHAPENRAYLRATHRHVFHVEVRVEVTHDNRDIEFHDLLDAVADSLPRNHDWGGRSCETLARIVAERVRALMQLPEHRPVRVSVFEDNEVGAIIE